MLVYLLFVAVVNLGLGLALAAYLGRRYRAMLEGNTWTEFDALAHDATADPNFAPQASPSPDAGEPPGRGQSCVTVIEEFLAQVDRFDSQLIDACDELRRCTQSADATAAEACFESLLAATGEHIQRCRDEYQQFAELTRRDDGWSGVHQAIRAAVRIQNTEVEMMNQAMAALDSVGVEDTCRDMAVRTNCLARANHHLRDTLSQAASHAACAHSQSPLGVAGTDPLTGLLSRVGLDGELRTWWENDPSRERRLSMAMLDLDQFARVNEEFGYRLGNEVLRAIGRLLAGECKGEIKSARIAGQRFTLLLPDSDLRSATDFVEQIRQAVEAVRFHHRERDLRVTVSCSVTEARPEDEAGSLYARAETALSETKHYGRNRTFVFEGEYPTPVVPPRLSIEKRHLTL